MAHAECNLQKRFQLKKKKKKKGKEKRFPESFLLLVKSPRRVCE